jgi:putative transposase
LELCRYVVLNPVRVKGNSQIGAWKWSSYRATAGLEAVPDFLTVNWILSQFGQKRAQAQKKYREFVAEGLDDRPGEKLRGQIFLATEEFIRRHRSRAERRNKRGAPTPTQARESYSASDFWKKQRREGYRRSVSRARLSDE